MPISYLLLCLLLLTLPMAARPDASPTSPDPASANDTEEEEGVPKDCLYRSMNPPESADPVLDYYNPNNKDSIPDFLTNDQLEYPRVVEFYSPTCPHCQQFASQYVYFARHFVNLTSFAVGETASPYAPLANLQFHAVSCIAHKAVCQHENIRNYPTIKIIPAHTTSADAIVIKDYQLHPFKLAKLLGVEVVPFPEPTTTTTKGGTRLRGKNKYSTNKRTTTTTTTTGKRQAPLERVETTSAINALDKNSPFLARTQQEVFADAYLSLYMTLKDSVFMETGPLAKDKQEKLKAFLQVLQDTLPPWRIHSLLGKLIHDFSRIVFHERVWSLTLEKYPPSSMEWSPACQAHGNGYTCGLWTLFHIVTVGAVEYNRANVIYSEEQAFLKMDAIAETLKDFIATFFICEECTTHFVQEYDNCTYDRCNRLKVNQGDDSNSNSGTLAEWYQLPLWLLENHNGVNIRLQKKRMVTNKEKSKIPTAEQEQDVMWPPSKECPSCWQEENGASSNYNHDITYKYLRLTYWPEDADARVIREEIRSLKSAPSKTAKERIEKSPTEITQLQQVQPKESPIITPKEELVIPELKVDSSSKSEQNHTDELLVLFLILAGAFVATKQKSVWQRHLLGPGKPWVEHCE